MKRISVLSIILACLFITAQAKVVLPSILGSDMVLQRNTNVNLWGTAEANKKVTITASWTKENFSVKADKDGKWATTIPTVDAGGPYTLTFDDGEKTELTNILLGEVWIAGGQSNMEMPSFSLVKARITRTPPRFSRVFAVTVSTFVCTFL